jgi:adenine-specific DNA-methyltransferase
VLLLAEGYDEGPTDHCRIHQARDADALSEIVACPRTWRPESPEAVDRL